VARGEGGLPAGIRTIRVNGYDMAYREEGTGEPLVLVHGSVNDYRAWAGQVPALAEHFRVFAVSLRRYYPDRWDGAGAFSWRQHVDDVAGFIGALGIGPAHLVGHSRGGYVALQVARFHPGTVRRLVLAEPGLPRDAILPPNEAAQRAAANFTESVRGTAALLEKGQVEAAAAFFIDGVSGAGTWATRSEAERAIVRDNIRTVLGEARDVRAAVTREDAARVDLPTLLVGGEKSPEPFGLVLDVLEAAMPKARRVTIAGASHAMTRSHPERFNEAVLDFLRGR
jgi:pimeloyl-ACP methyl ester carboxylesterase